ncbi:MAG: hypothetical protein ACTSXG_04415, partial [Alphaproteobacteria bacterium]
LSRGQLTEQLVSDYSYCITFVASFPLSVNILFNDLVSRDAIKGDVLLSFTLLLLKKDALNLSNILFIFNPHFILNKLHLDKEQIKFN